ncbi:hypothetical protein BD309DRAFT_410172 [Dichomitus squalens]|nr:hypothetical protein BD309DRAFT_410172 [Dichomitus squalens]
MAGPPLATSHATSPHLLSSIPSSPSSQPPRAHNPFAFPQPHSSASGPPSAQFASTPAQSPPPSQHLSLLPSASSSARQSLAPTRASSSSTHSDKPVSSNSAAGKTHTSSNSPAAAGSGPTNDDIEAVIQMAMASSNSPRTSNPPRDTRTQLFVGNVRPFFLLFSSIHASPAPFHFPSCARPATC